MKQYWVYVLKVDSGDYRIGFSTNLKETLKTYQPIERSTLKKLFRSSGKPAIVWYMSYKSPYDAGIAQRTMESWPTRKLEALLRGDFNCMRELKLS